MLLVWSKLFIIVVRLFADVLSLNDDVGQPPKLVSTCSLSLGHVNGREAGRGVNSLE